MEEIDSFLKEYPINTEITVAWADMDALQHVNNVVYFKYFEIARIDFFNQINLLKICANMTIGPVISENNAKYKYPITFPDNLTIGVKITDIESDRFLMHYYAYSHRLQKVATIGSSKVVMFDFKAKQKATLTPEILNLLRKYG